MGAVCVAFHWLSASRCVGSNHILLYRFCSIVGLSKYSPRLASLLARRWQNLTDREIARRPAVQDCSCKPTLLELRRKIHQFALAGKARARRDYFGRCVHPKAHQFGYTVKPSVPSSVRPASSPASGVITAPRNWSV